MKTINRAIYMFVLYAALFISFTACRNGNNDGKIQDFDKKSPLRDDSDIQKSWEIQKSFQKIYDLYEDRVVFISTEDRVTLPYHPFYEFFGIPQVQKQTGLGSGFIVSENGFICTNFHVIAPDNRVVDKVTVIIGDKRYEAEVRGFDAQKDVAILKIEPDMQLKPVFFGSSDNVQVGDWAIAIGNPFGLSKSFTVGVVSATGRKNIDLSTNAGFIQTDAAINPGNSGGPLLDIRGEVIGINRMLYSKSGGYMGIGFAIPINSVKELILELKDKKYVHKGFIGIALAPLNSQLRDELGWNRPDGIVVANVQPGGPAHEAGIQSGDIIINANGTRIKSPEDFIAIIEQTEPGSTVQLTVWRDGNRRNITVETIRRPTSVR
ncbi:MAG: S1C family serine protease [Spirochaetota bacterium]